MNENYRLLKPFLRGLPIIILVMVIAVMVAKKYLSYVTPKYEATAKLKLADVHEGVPGSNLFRDFDVFASANKIAGEIELMKSGVLLNKVLDSLDFDLEIFRVGKLRSVELYHESPLIIKVSLHDPKAYDKKYKLRVSSKTDFTLTIPGIPKPIKGKLGSIVSCDYGKLYIGLNESYLAGKLNARLIDQYEFEIISREKLLAKVSKGLDIAPIDKDVAVIRITYQSPVPEKAATLANKLAKVYIYDYIESKYKAANTTVDFLGNEINDVSNKLSQSENQIENYRDDKKITNIRQETETDLRAISQMKIQLTNEKMNLEAMNRLYDYIQSGKENFLELAPNFEAFTDLLSTEIVKNIKKLQAEKKDLLLSYTPQEEKVKVIDEKINDLKSYLIESISNTRRSHQIKLAKLTTEIAEAEKAFIGVPEKEKMLNILNRNFELYQKSYNFLTEKKIEAEIAQAAKMSFHRIIEEAAPASTPISPNKAIIVIVSGILGLIGSLLLIYMVHAAKAKVNDSITIEKKSSIPIAAEVPLLSTTALIHSHFHKLALQLELKKIINHNSVITLSSYLPKEGKRFITAELAKELARQGRTILIVDVDGQFNNARIEDTDHISIHTFQKDELAVLNSITLSTFVASWKEMYDIVLIKNEGLKDSPNSLLFMNVADVNLFIADSRLTPAKMIDKTEMMKEQFQLPQIYFLLNRAGYNPNVITQAWVFAKALYIKLRKKIKK